MTMKAVDVLQIACYTFVTIVPMTNNCMSRICDVHHIKVKLNSTWKMIHKSCTMDAMVCGCYMYEKIWYADVGGGLSCMREVENYSNLLDGLSIHKGHALF